MSLAHAEPKAYIIIGQSNACGRGVPSELTDHDKAMPTWMHYSASRNGQIINSTWSSTNQWGMEIALKNTLWTDRYIYNVLHYPPSTEQAYIIKTCVIEPIHKWQRDGVGFSRLMETIVRAKLPADVVYKAIFLIQGESDRGFTEFAGTWAERAAVAITDIRNALGSQSIPLIYTQVGVDIYPPDYLTMLRESQAKLETILPEAYMVDMSYVPKTDGLHYTSPRQLADLLYGKYLKR